MESIEPGPQYKGDNPFTARMRLHQSWWRSARLGVAWGTNSRGLEYGNYLREGDAERGANFLTPAIHRCVRSRIKAGPGVEPFRCLRNLLSSQPMAFNLFGPLCDDAVLAARLLDPLLPGGAQSAEVRIEWAPPRAEHLGDATSFDVEIRYRTRAGHQALAAIETKLTEPFSPQSYGLNDRRAEAYRRVARASSAWIDPMSEQLADRRWNQIWRNQLLVESIRLREPGLLGAQIVVHHEADEGCARNARQYAEFLTDPEMTFRRLTLRDVVMHWRPLLRDQAQLRWLQDFEDRYLNLSLSEGVLDLDRRCRAN
ncbi:MAG: hypothetical protein U1E30_12495 [Rhodoblastus sp.]